MGPRTKCPSTPTTILLVIACGALIMLILYEISGNALFTTDVRAAGKRWPDKSLAETAAQLAMPSEFAPPSVEEFAVIYQRPLFSASRRPFAAPRAAQEALNYELVGVFVGPKNRWALLRAGDRLNGASSNDEGDPDDGYNYEDDDDTYMEYGQTLRLGEEDVIEGWWLASITSDKVILHQDEEVQVLHLHDPYEDIVNERVLD